MVCVGFSMEDARQLCEDAAAEADARKIGQVLTDLQYGNTRFWMVTSNCDAANAFQRVDVHGLGMYITVQIQMLAFQACVRTRPATNPTPALLVTKRVAAQNTDTIATGRVVACQLPSTMLNHASSDLIKFEETIITSVIRRCRADRPCSV